MRSTFSITTIASSTRIPIASTIPNRVSTLIEKPNIQRPRHATDSAIGTTTVGITVARQCWRTRNMTRKQTSHALHSVLTTSSIDRLQKGIVISGKDEVYLCGKALTKSALNVTVTPGGQGAR